MDSLQAYKDKIGMRIAGIISESLSKKIITEDQSDEIATYILENIDLAKSNSELFAFVEGLSVKWPIFNSILTSSDQVQVPNPIQDKTDQVTHTVGDLLRENKIDEALQVAKTATEIPNENPQNGIGGIV
jgi:hypothetical protein